MKRYSLSKTTIFLVLMVLLLVTSLIAGRWFLLHTQLSLEHQASQALSQEEELQLAHKLGAQYTDAQSYLAELTSFIHGDTSDRSLAFIKSIEALARHVGVPLTITYAGVQENMVFVIKAGGAFNTLYRLVALIETSSYPVVVEALSLTASGEGKSKQWSLESTLRLLPVSSTTNPTQ